MNTMMNGTEKTLKKLPHTLGVSTRGWINWCFIENCKISSTLLLGCINWILWIFALNWSVNQHLIHTMNAFYTWQQLWKELWEMYIKVKLVNYWLIVCMLLYEIFFVFLLRYMCVLARKRKLLLWWRICWLRKNCVLYSAIRWLLFN